MSKQSCASCAFWTVTASQARDTQGRIKGDCRVRPPEIHPLTNIEPSFYRGRWPWTYGYEWCAYWAKRIEEEETT